MTALQAISSDELNKHIHDDNIKIIDLRSADSYNGWRLLGEKRSGHIKNAKCFPHKWFNNKNWPGILKSKNVKPEHSIIIYGGSDNEFDLAAESLAEEGYKSIKVYRDFFIEWSRDGRYPMEHLARYDKLVPPEWLNSLINGDKPGKYDNDRYVICHCHYRNPDDYERDHIAQAIELDTNWLESERTWNRRTPKELEDVLKRLGIESNTTVIVYGRFSSPENEDPFPGSKAGHLGAFRAGFILKYAGVKDVRILNGGMQTWTEHNFEITKKEFKPDQIAEFGVEIPAFPEIVIDTPEAKQYINDEHKNLVSVRSWEEYLGEVSGYHYIKKKGRIPGSVFGNGGSDAYHMENYRNPDHTVREFHEIERMLARGSITPDKYNAFYCGTGWRASEAFWDVWFMGWNNIALYDGGWFEWSNDSANPIETGLPENTGVKG